MKIDSLDELESYIFLLEDNYERVITDDQELLELLKSDFNVECSLKEIQVLREPTIEEDNLDRQLLLRNIYA